MMPPMAKGTISVIHGIHQQEFINNGNTRTQ